MSNYKLDTICVQGGYKPENGEPRTLPIYQSTTYKYDSADHLGDLFDLKADGVTSQGRQVFRHCDKLQGWSN